MLSEGERQRRARGLERAHDHNIPHSHLPSDAVVCRADDTR
jgi:hypothetical protein